MAAAALFVAAAAVSQNRGQTGSHDDFARPPTVTSGGSESALPNGTSASIGTTPAPSRKKPPTVPRPVRSGPFALVVHMRTGDITATVGSMAVASNQSVDPPHETALQWNTPVWIRQSSYPAAPSTGTSYVYGHACHHHICPFTHLKDAQVGNQVVVTTKSGTLTYQITRTGLSPKTAAALPAWASDSTVPNRLILVTCAFESGDTSTENIVVVARLQGT